MTLSVGLVGWRLTLEPHGVGYGWSLIRQSDAGTQVWAGVVDDSSAELVLVEGLVTAADPMASGLLHPSTEASLAAGLTALVPGQLRDELLELDGPDASRTTHTVTIAARGWLSRVPWPAVALDARGTRLVECCRLVGALPTGVISAHRPAGVPAPGRGLVVVDPGPLSGLEEPIYPTGYPSGWYAAAAAERLVPDGLPYSPEDLSRDLNAAEIDRLLYVGHIRSAPDDIPAAAGLVLSDSDGAVPLTAQQWFARPERWPAPRSVALIGCGSDDAGHREQTGLAMAALAAGAHHVLATRWVLPADGPDHTGTTDLGLAVFHLQRAERVVTELARWQRARLAVWRAGGAIEASPLFWASLVAYSTPTVWARQV